MSLMVAKGDELLRFIESLDELEWAKFESRFPNIQTKDSLISEDRSTHPPYTSFRFCNEKQEIVAKLTSAIESYVGGVEWVMNGREREVLSGKNWMICPRKVHDAEPLAIAAGQPVWKYFKENDPNFGPQAYADLLSLVDHVKSVFEKS